MSFAGGKPEWLEANQRQLTAAVGVVRAQLEVCGSNTAEASSQLAQARAELERAEGMMHEPPAIDRLCAIFGLSSFERQVLVLAAGVELSSALGELCARLLSEPSKPQATFGLALAALPAAHWSALTPASPLRRWRLIEVLPGQSLTSGAIRIDERVLGYLTGLEFLDERVSGFVDRVPPHAGIAPS